MSLGWPIASCVASFWQAPVADASELADAVAVLHPETRFFLVQRPRDDGCQAGRAPPFVDLGQRNPSPSMNDIAGFLSACRAQEGQPEIVWQAFGDVLSRPASNDLIARFSRQSQRSSASGARALLGEPAARCYRTNILCLPHSLAFNEHDLATTKWLLGKVDLASLDFLSADVDRFAYRCLRSSRGFRGSARSAAQRPSPSGPSAPVCPPCRRARAGHRVSRSALDLAQCPLIQAAATDPCACDPAGVRRHAYLEVLPGNRLARCDASRGTAAEMDEFYGQIADEQALAALASYDIAVLDPMFAGSIATVARDRARAMWVTRASARSGSPQL